MVAQKVRTDKRRTFFIEINNFEYGQLNCAQITILSAIVITDYTDFGRIAQIFYVRLNCGAAGKKNVPLSQITEKRY